MVASSIASSAIPPHPCSSLISHATKSTTHGHPIAYHSFINSPYFPIASTEATKTNKRVKKSLSDDFPALINPVEGEIIDASALHSQLLDWFETKKEAREMPWRKAIPVPSGESELSKEETKDLRERRNQRAYEVWISEIMLQQTQVTTVIAYFNVWLDKFPTVKDLAEADIEDVNAVWKGLGYYSRASRLLAGAKTVMQDFGGFIPKDVDGLLKIDGIGPYSAGAISSIAFGRRVPLVDGNVARVLSRLTALHSVATSKSTTSFLWTLADLLVPSTTLPVSTSSDSTNPALPVLKSSSTSSAANPGADFPSTLIADIESTPISNKVPHPPTLEDVNRPGAWNQALMELGSTICKPANPSCAECPIKRSCLAWNEIKSIKPRSIFASGAIPKLSTKSTSTLCTLCEPFNPVKTSLEVTQYPMKKVKKVVREEETCVAVLEWTSSIQDDGQKDKWVLITRRPEKGLLAGLYEFPAIDLDPKTEAESTSSQRALLLTKLLRTLLVDYPSSKNSDASSSLLKIKSSSPIPSITQIYSHQKRHYHPHLTLLSSPSLPLLTPSDTRAKWVKKSKVEGSNLGGAMMKVWEVREGGKGNGIIDRMQVAKSAKKVVEKKNGRKRAKSEEESEEKVLLSESDEASMSEVEAKIFKVQVKVEEIKVVKKKRRIIISDDEDEET